MAAGRLDLLHDAYDLTRIPLHKKAAAKRPRISDALVVQLVDRLLEVARRSAPRRSACSASLAPPP